MRDVAGEGDGYVYPKIKSTHPKQPKEIGYCTRDGNVLLDNYRFCPKCGAPVVRCKKCQDLLGTDDKFCRKCGHACPETSKTKGD